MSNDAERLKIYGGQAVIEGVMMRGSRALAVAVRNPQGQIVIHSEPLNPRIYQRWTRIPLVRGLVMLWDALGLGIRALMFSADVALEEEDGVTAGQAFSGPAQWATVLVSLTFSIALFFALPAFVGGLVERWLGDSTSAHFISHAVEGGIRLTLLVGYIVLIGRMEDIRRVFGYHGAEHKTINAYEAGAELTPEVVAGYPLEHPRCGTAFLLTVVIFSIILFSLLPEWEWLTATLGPVLTRVLTRIVLIPVVAALAYEYIRFSARRQEWAVVRWLTRPNLALQRLTTREPDAAMLTVAIAAFQQMTAMEEGRAGAGVGTFTLEDRPAGLLAEAA